MTSQTVTYLDQPVNPWAAWIDPTKDHPTRGLQLRLMFSSKKVQYRLTAFLQTIFPNPTFTSSLNCAEKKVLRIGWTTTFCWTIAREDKKP